MSSSERLQGGAVALQSRTHPFRNQSCNPWRSYARSIHRYDRTGPSASRENAVQCNGIVSYSSGVRAGSSREDHSRCCNGPGTGIAARATITAPESADHDGALSGTECVDAASSADGAEARILLLQPPGRIEALVMIVIESRLPSPEWVSEWRVAALHPGIDCNSTSQVFDFNLPSA